MTTQRHNTDNISKWDYFISASEKVEIVCRDDVREYFFFCSQTIPKSKRIADEEARKEAEVKLFIMAIRWSMFTHVFFFSLIDDQIDVVQLKKGVRLTHARRIERKSHSICRQHNAKIEINLGQKNAFIDHVYFFVRFLSLTNAVRFGLSRSDKNTKLTNWQRK